MGFSSYDLLYLWSATRLCYSDLPFHLLAAFSVCGQQVILDKPVRITEAELTTYLMGWYLP